MEISFKEKVVLVTGSSRGIGKAIAARFADCGAQVAVHYARNQSAAADALSSLRGTGHIIVQGDLSRPESVLSLFNKVMESKGRVDILVNNAGIYEEADWWDLDYEAWQEHWRRTMDTNINGPAHLSFLVARQMIARGGGKIVNITSRGAFRGEPHALPYGTAKAGLNSFGQSMAWALANKNIQVFTLAPGWVETDMTSETLAGNRGGTIRAQSPLNRVASPGEIARAVIMLASDGLEYMTGCIVDMNGASYLRS
jgi:NAD(P)-dependent dehydrogenase (short-subunit alcohol dehydrogenase family)